MEFLNLLNGLSLRKEEEGGFHIEELDISSSKEECTRSLIGRIFGDKIANFTGLKKALDLVWRLDGPMKMRELATNKYQFVFSRMEDRDRVLAGKAWTFESQFLILKPWQEGTDYSKDDFSKLPLWVQIWNLPSHWMSKEVGMKFSNVFGSIHDVLIPESGSKQGRHIKILATIDLNKPLLRGTKITCGADTVWAVFRYEHLAAFCFYCGKVGHLERHCYNRKRDAAEGNILEGQYGQWLKADSGRTNPNTGKTSPETSSAKADHLVILTGAGNANGTAKNANKLHESDDPSETLAEGESTLTQKDAGEPLQPTGDDNREPNVPTFLL